MKRREIEKRTKFADSQEREREREIERERELEKTKERNKERKRKSNEKDGGALIREERKKEWKM